jgi:hypothetical protein
MSSTESPSTAATLPCCAATTAPKLACAAMADWATERVGLAFIPPGQAVA